MIDLTDDHLDDRERILYMDKAQSKLKNGIIFSIAFIVFAAIVSICTIYDYSVSSSIADPNLLWTKILDILGEIPALLFTGFNIALIIAYLRKNDVKNKNLLYVVSGILLFISGFYPFNKIFSFSELSAPLIVLICSIGGLAVSALFIKITFSFSDDLLKRYIKTAFTCVGVAISVLVIITVLKVIWGRPRFYELNGTDVLFSPWYIPHLFSGHRSFPSGHTSNATMIYMIAAYFPKQRKWLCPLIGLWIAAVAISRVYAGAHFMTDVIFGCTFTFIICYVWCKKTGIWNSAK